MEGSAHLGDDTHEGLERLHRLLSPPATRLHHVQQRVRHVQVAARIKSNQVRLAKALTTSCFTFLALLAL